MRRLLTVALLLLVAADCWAGLSTLSRRKTYAVGEIFRASDYHADLDAFIAAYNAVAAYFPGDTLKRPIVAADTLIPYSGAIINVKSGFLLQDEVVKW